MSNMAFNPPVPVAKAVKPTARSKEVYFVDEAFRQKCNSVKNQNKCFYIDISKVQIKE